MDIVGLRPGCIGLCHGLQVAIRGGSQESINQLVLSACIDGVVTDLKAANCRVRRGKHKVMKKFLTPGRLSGT